MFEGVPKWLVRIVIYVANHWDWLGRKLNAFAINSIVNECRHRPHPWSTVSDYVSWTSLSDMHWSARHLPAYHGGPKPIPPEKMPEEIKDIFKRPEGKPRFCEKSTVLFPAFAQYLTDGFIRTRMPNKSAGETDEVRKQNTSNHEIDLCPLYGRTAAQIDALRLKNENRGQRGRLKSQTIGDEEYSPFLYQPDGAALKPEFSMLDTPLGIDNYKDKPELLAKLFACGGDRVNSSVQISMMNTLLLREHNRLAGEIESRNPQWDDERVFQVARNILIVVFIKIVVEDYINHISPVGFRLRADPSVAWNAPWNKPNWITTEFSLLYRWHSLIPDMIKFNGEPFAISQVFMDNRPLLAAGLKRAFVDVSTERAGRLGALNTASHMVDIEMRAVNQGRLCNVAPYGDYRQYIGLPRPTSFDDISTDRRIVDALRKAYKDPKEIEFYVGLFAEDTVPDSPLPPLILRLVAVDAFSQALTNPLLSEQVFNEDTFTKFGWETIHNTGKLRDLLARNVPGGLKDEFISMTRAGWKGQS
jgi:prostaglandin-endoperoxide synthase 2